MWDTFEKTRRAGIVAGAGFWVAVAMVAILPYESGMEWVFALLAFAAYLGNLAAAYAMRQFSTGTLGLSPVGWFIFFLLMPFAAVVVFPLWKPERPYTPLYSGQCAICRNHAVSGAKKTIYTAYYVKRYLGSTREGTTEYHQYRVTHYDIRPHELRICRHCLRRRLISVGAIIGLLLIAVAAMALRPVFGTRLIAVAICITSLLGSIYVGGRWADLGSQLKTAAVLLRTDGRLRKEIVPLSVRQYDRLKREGQEYRQSRKP